MIYKVNTRKKSYLFVHKHDKTILELNSIVEGCRLRAKALVHDDEFNVKTLEEHFLDEMHFQGFDINYAHDYYIKEL